VPLKFRQKAHRGMKDKWKEGINGVENDGFWHGVNLTGRE